MKSLVWLVGFSAISAQTAFAAVSADRIHNVDSRKTQIYMKDGVFTGGHRDIEAAVIRDIRRANNAGYERIVLDIDSAKIPYYQVAVDPALKRVTLTVFGDPTLSFQAPEVVKAFQKSATVSRVDLYPKVDGSTFNMVLQLKGSSPIEVFELGSPNRIIFDLKVASNISSESKPVTHFVGKKKKAKKVENTQVYPAESDAVSDGESINTHTDESAPE